VVCSKCNSSDLKKVSLIYAAGTYQSRGGFLGCLIGSGLLFGRYRETSQSRLAASLRPPRKAPCVSPIIFWLVGCFPVLSLIANEIRAPLKGTVAIAYFLLLPVCCLAALFYNVLVRVCVLRRRLPKHHEHGAPGLQTERHGGATIRDRKRHRLRRTSFGAPQSWRFASYPECRTNRPVA